MPPGHTYDEGLSKSGRGDHLDWRCLVPNGLFNRTAGGGTFPTPYPTKCHSAVSAYLKLGSYDADVESAIDDARAAFNFTSSAAAASRYGGGDVDPASCLAVVFDIDETVLCNIKSRVTNLRHLLNSSANLSAALVRWHYSEDTPAIVPVLKLYHELWRRGYHPTFITGRSDGARPATEVNLAAAGYGTACSSTQGFLSDRDTSKPCYVQLDLRGPRDKGTSATVYKGARRRQLQERGWHIVGNFGDQFSDLSGDPLAQISVKLPNPVYYIL